MYSKQGVLQGWKNEEITERKDNKGISMREEYMQPLENKVRAITRKTPETLEKDRAQQEMFHNRIVQSKLNGHDFKEMEKRTEFIRV